MTRSSSWLILALAAAMPASLMAQAVQDFSLPPAPTPSASPRAQGPIDEESGPVAARPRAIPTPTATPTATPTSSSTRTTAIPIDEEVVTEPRRDATGVVPPQSRPSAAQPPVAQPPVSEPTADADIEGVAELPIQEPEASVAAPPIESSLEASEVGAFDWRLLAGIGSALLAVLGGLFIWRRRRAKAPPPMIERPIVRAAAEPQTVPAAQMLSIRCEAEKLTRSAVYATLKYRLTLVNRTDLPLTDVAIGLDLASAHAGAPMEDQVATAGTTLDTRHRLARIAPHQTVTVEGQVQLPLATAQVILQGRHPLLVPLLRVRVDGLGEGVLVKTFVVGQGSPDGGRVQPFRLDEPPRSYAPLAHRELA